MIPPSQDGEAVCDEQSLADAARLLEADAGHASFGRRDGEVCLAFCKRLTMHEAAAEHANPKLRSACCEMLQSSREDADLCEIRGGENERSRGLRWFYRFERQHGIAKLLQCGPQWRSQLFRFGGHHELVTLADEQQVVEELAKSSQPVAHG
jgi:hypothetical protein